MNKVYIVRYYDSIYNVFMSRGKAEEYIKLLGNPMNIHYDTDYTIEEYEPKDDCLEEEWYSVEATMYADRRMEKTLDCVKVELISGADVDIYGDDSDIDFQCLKNIYCAKDKYYIFILRARFLKDNNVSVDEIKNRYTEAVNKAFEKYVELIEQGQTSEQALRVINKKLEEEGI